MKSHPRNNMKNYIILQWKILVRDDSIVYNEKLAPSNSIRLNDTMRLNDSC